MPFGENLLASWPTELAAPYLLGFGGDSLEGCGKYCKTFWEDAFTLWVI